MEENQSKDSQPSVADIIKFALIVIAIVVPFRLWIAQPYIVEGSSMIPTFKDGDYLIVDQISLRAEEPSRGEVIIMKYPRDPKKFFIKRIIGLPGETLSIEKGEVFVKSSPENLAQKVEENYVIYKKDENFTVVLKENEYFVLGDNRSGSSDSRVWGPLPKANIVGRPILRLLPLKNIDVFPGDESF